MKKKIELIIQRAERAADKALPNTIEQIARDMKELTADDKQRYIGRLWESYNELCPMYDVEAPARIIEILAESLTQQHQQPDKDEAVILNFMFDQERILRDQFLNLKNYQYAKSLVAPKRKSDKEPGLREQALRAVWINEVIPPGRDKISQHYSYYQKLSNRISFHKEKEKTSQQRENKLYLFQRVIDSLPKEYKQKAIDELKTLKASVEN